MLYIYIPFPDLLNSLMIVDWLDWLRLYLALIGAVT